jgi:hypothetical protein
MIYNGNDDKVKLVMIIMTIMMIIIMYFMVLYSEQVAFKMSDLIIIMIDNTMI